VSREHAAVGMSRGGLCRGSEACFLGLGVFLGTTCPRLTICSLRGCRFPRLSFLFFGWTESCVCNCSGNAQSRAGKARFTLHPWSPPNVCVPRTRFWLCLKCCMERGRKDDAGGGVLMVQPPPSNCPVLGWRLGAGAVGASWEMQHRDGCPC